MVDPEDPLFLRHLVQLCSLGCTTRICYVTTEALHLKQAKKIERRVVTCQNLSLVGKIRVGVAKRMLVHEKWLSVQDSRPLQPIGNHTDKHSMLSGLVR